MTNTHLRSVLLETRTYRDTAGQANSSGLLCINGRLVASFPLHYGSPAITEEYHAAPYLEALGILSEHDRHRAVGNRLRALGVDYYLTEAVMRRRDCFRHGHQMTPEEYREEMAYSEKRRASMVATAEDTAQEKKDPKNPANQIGYECEQCGGEPPEVSTYEMKDGRVFCDWCRDEVNP